MATGVARTLCRFLCGAAVAGLILPALPAKAQVPVTGADLLTAYERCADGVDGSDPCLEWTAGALGGLIALATLIGGRSPFCVDHLVKDPKIFYGAVATDLAGDERLEETSAAGALALSLLRIARCPGGPAP